VHETSVARLASRFRTRAADAFAALNVLPGAAVQQPLGQLRILVSPELHQPPVEDARNKADSAGRAGIARPGHVQRPDAVLVQGRKQKTLGQGSALVLVNRAMQVRSTPRTRRFANTRSFPDGHKYAESELNWAGGTKERGAYTQV